MIRGGSASIEGKAVKVAEKGGTQIQTEASFIPLQATRHVVTRTSLLSVRVPVHSLLSRIGASAIHSHTSTSPPRRI